MKKYILNIIWIGLLACGSANAQNQSETDTIRIPSHFLQQKVESNKVILRWAPSSYSYFVLGLENGYVVQRKAYSKNSELEGSLEQDADFKTITNIKPFTLQEWQTKATDTSDIYVGAAMQIQLGNMGSEKDLDDDGGMLGQYENDMRKFSFALLASDFSALAAEGLGLRFEDLDVKPGQFYEYRVLMNAVVEGIALDTAYSSADMTNPTEKLAVRHCFTEVEDKKISVFWTRHNDQFFTAYDVERTTDNKTWLRLNSKPFITSRTTEGTPNFYVDTNVVYGQNYTYRVRGYTPFGEKGLYSEPFSEKGVDLKGPAPAWGLKANDMGGFVGLSWEAQPIETDFDGFYVERSNAADGHFEKISDKLPAQAREFADLMPIALESNYYRIVTSDKSGNESYSFSTLGYIVDSVAPEMPSGLMGLIDTNGIVSLKWNPAEEADVIGYRVYWSNNAENEFTQLTGDILPVLTFADSINLNTLNSDIYYRVVAVDHRYNHSKPSEILTLKKPDIIPPAKPLIYDYSVSKNSIELKWHKSSSADVKTQTIMKKQDNGNWAVVKSWQDNAIDNYSDLQIQKGGSYIYKIVCVDEAGNTSESQELRISIAQNGEHLVNQSATLKIVENKAILEWSASSEKVKYVIFKSNNNDTKRLASLYSPNVTWTDNSFAPGDEYQMRLYFPNGDESQLITFKAKN